MLVTFFQGGSRQKNIGWALCSNDDVIKSMTSLLLLHSTKILGGHVPPVPPCDYPLQLSDSFIDYTKRPTDLQNSIQEGFMSKQSFSEKNSKFRFPPLSSMTLLRQDMGKCRFFLLDLLRFELGLLQKMTHCRSQTQCDISLICCLLFLFSIQHHNKSNTKFIKRRDTIH